MAVLGYTWYPKDFISDPDVMFMTAAERGVYRDLIDLAYISDNKISYSVEMLSRYTNSDINTVEHILKLKGLKKGEFWTIPSCEKRMKLAKKNRENGTKGGRPKTQNKPSTNPVRNSSVTLHEAQTVRQREIEREIESKVVVVEETTTRPTSTPRFGICSTHIELKSHLKSLSIWKAMFAKQSQILNPEHADIWIDKFVDFAIANGKGESILTVSEAQSYCLNWVTKRIEAGDKAFGSASAVNGGVKFIDGKIIPTGAVQHG